jgi:hypothetical protein
MHVVTPLPTFVVKLFGAPALNLRIHDEPCGLSNGCAIVLKQSHTAQSSANEWFVTMLSGAAYRLELRAIVGVVMQRGVKIRASV